MGWSHGQRWTTERVVSELAPHAKRLGRMPSMPELRSAGRNDLACAVMRLGLKKVRQQLGLDLKPSQTEMGQRWEVYVEGVLRSLGHQVERQTTRAPFDLLVDGRVRVNVKSATFRSYRTGNSVCSGHFFGIGHTAKRCDVFALVRVDGSDTPAVLWVRSSELQQQTLTLTKNHPFHQRTSSKGLWG